MDVNTSITEPTTITAEIQEFYAAQIDRLIGLGREDLVAELAADYNRLLAEHAHRSNPIDAADPHATSSLAPEREAYYTTRVNELIAEGREDLIDVLVADYQRELRAA
jgi:hypothetical protein